MDFYSNDDFVLHSHLLGRGTIHVDHTTPLYHQRCRFAKTTTCLATQGEF